MRVKNPPRKKARKSFDRALLPFSVAGVGALRYAAFHFVIYEQKA